MLEVGTIRQPDRTGTLGKAAGSPETLPLRLTIVMSAYNIAMRMIRFSDENESFVAWVAIIVMTIAP
jgi:hypothetical protein